MSQATRPTNKRKRAQGSSDARPAQAKPTPAATSSSLTAHPPSSKRAKKASDASGNDDDDSDEDNEAQGAAPRSLGIFERPILSLASHPLPGLRQLSTTLSRFSALQRLDISSMQPSQDNPDGLNSLEFVAKAVTMAQKEAKPKVTPDEPLESLHWFGNSLTTLDLRENASMGKQSEKAWDGLQKLIKLKVLNASHCALSAFPPLSILPLSLCALILSHNDLTTFGTLPLLPNLNTLVLSHNALSSLPKTLPASLPALKKLSLSDNRLVSPRSKGQDKGQAKANVVVGLPDLTTCSHLREVRLNGNAGIEALPSHMATWGRGIGKDAKGTGLEVLELGDCSLQSWEDIEALFPSSGTDQTQGEGDRRRRRGLKNLTLKGNPVTGLEGFKDKILESLPDLAVLDGQRLQPKKAQDGDKMVDGEAMDTSPDADVDEAVEDMDRRRSRAGPPPGEAEASTLNSSKGKRKHASDGRGETNQDAARAEGATQKVKRTLKERIHQDQGAGNDKRSVKTKGRGKAKDEGEEEEDGSTSLNGTGKGTGTGKTHRGARGSKKGKKDGNETTSKAKGDGVNHKTVKKDAFLVFEDEGEDGKDKETIRHGRLGVTSDSEDEEGMGPSWGKKGKKGGGGGKMDSVRGSNSTTTAGAGAGANVSMGMEETKKKKHKRGKRGKGALGGGKASGEDGDEDESGKGADWLYAKLDNRKSRKREAEGEIMELGESMTDQGHGEVGAEDEGEGKRGGVGKKGKGKTKGKEGSIGKSNAKKGASETPKKEKEKARGAEASDKGSKAKGKGKTKVLGPWDADSEPLPAPKPTPATAPTLVPQSSAEVEKSKEPHQRADKAQTSVVGIVEVRKSKSKGQAKIKDGLGKVQNQDQSQREGVIGSLVNSFDALDQDDVGTKPGTKGWGLARMDVDVGSGMGGAWD